MSILVFPCPFSAGVCKPFFSIVVWCCKVGSASEEYFWKWRYVNLRLRLRRGLNQVKLFAHSAAKWLTPGSDDDDQYGAINYWHNYVYLDSTPLIISGYVPSESRCIDRVFAKFTATIDPIIG